MLVVVKIGDRLRDLRVRRALTQEELAEKADVGTNTVANPMCKFIGLAALRA
jgi:transcriptional regulator with XRE-family HTH domain